MKQRVKTSLIILSVAAVVNLVLAFVKLYVGLSCNSLCIMLDAVNSFFDIATAIVAIVAFALLLKPKSEKHPFGFGRSEYVAGFVVSVVSVIVGAMFLLESVNRLAMPEPVWFGLQSCILICVALIVKLGLALFFYFFNKKLKSKALSAFTLDSFLDLGITCTSLISFAISSKVNYAVDAFFGLAISLIVLAVGIKMVVDNLKILIGNGDTKDEQSEIIRLCESNPKIVSITNVILHDYGYFNKIGSAEVQFLENVTFDEAIRILDNMKASIKEKIGATVEFCPTKKMDNLKSDNE